MTKEFSSSSFDAWWEIAKDTLINNGVDENTIKTLKELTFEAWNGGMSQALEEVEEANVIINKGIWEHLKVITGNP